MTKRQNDNNAQNDIQQQDSTNNNIEALVLTLSGGKNRLSTMKKFVIERRRYEGYAQERVYNLVLALMKYLIRKLYGKNRYLRPYIVVLDEVVRSKGKHVFSNDEEVQGKVNEFKEDLKQTLVSFCSYAINTQHWRSREDEAQYKEFLRKKPIENFGDDDVQYSVDQYTDRLMCEAEILILSGLQREMNQKDLLDEYKSSMRGEFPSDFVKENLKDSVVMKSIWSDHEETFQKHTAKSAPRGLAVLTSYILAKTWMQYLLLRNNTDYYMVMRGSSYPCEMCQEQVGIHKGVETLPPYHRNCCCIAVPISYTEYAIIS